MIKYLGSKRALLPVILDMLRPLRGVRSAVDLFAGTSRVGHALKGAGLRVLSNDHNAFAETLARCYVQADAEEVEADARRLIAELNALPGAPGYFTETFCERSRFFQPKNGARVDAIREAIARKALPPELEAVLLASLMEAADRVDSTTGVQMAYLKAWAPRSFNDLTLRLPAVLPRARHGKGEAHALDAVEAAGVLEADLMYLDPPYNQHKYLGNYHIWESLVRWDKPEVFGVACKRVDCQTRRSVFNARAKSLPALRQIIASARARYLLVSFSDEGHLAREELEALLAERGRVTVLAIDHKRYVGAKIGICNPAGERIGTVSHTANTEYLFLVSPRSARRVAARPANPRSDGGGA